MRYISVVVLFVAFSVIPAVAEQSVPLKIVWFANLYEKPDTTDNPFWSLTKQFIEASAEDLGVDLNIVHTNQNHIYLMEEAEKLLQNINTRPQAILFHNYKFTGKKLLRLAEKYKVKSFVFNSGFAEKENVGKPGEKYKHWIGELYPDDAYAGWLLAKKLMEEAANLPGVNPEKKVKAFSFAGSTHSQASILRVKGNDRFQSENSDYNNVSTFYADWSKDRVFNATNRIVKRLPELKIFWTASDQMALGVIEGAIKHGWLPGKDFVVGGVDCLPETQELVKKGLISVSVGGHYTDGAWAILLIHDYLKGVDFSGDHGVTLSSKMFAITSGGYEKYSDLSHKLSRQYIDLIDFRLYSRWYNKKMISYPLDALSFLD